MSASEKKPAETFPREVFEVLDENLDWVGALAELSLAHAHYRVRFQQPEFPHIDWGGINKLIGYHLDLAYGQIQSIQQFLVEKKLTYGEERK